MQLINQKKAALQHDTKLKWYGANCRGTLALATGAGKSKIAIDVVVENSKWENIYLVVPTEKLRDENWHEEFKKWHHPKDYHRLKRVCYASLTKIKDEEIDLIICDEFHNVTELNSSFFTNNKVKRVLGLTATPPEDQVKQDLFKKIAPVIYTYKLDEGVRDGIIAPFEITIVECRLDTINKYIQAGTKDKPFMTTEDKHYQYLSKQVLLMQYAGKKEVAKYKIIDRMRFIYNLQSKTEVAKKIIVNQLKDKRSLIFCGSIQQANELCEHRFHSKTSDKDLKRLISGEISQLSSVNCLNEGINIPDLEAAVIVQLNSKEKDTIQRIGRLLRMRDGHLAQVYILTTINTVDETWCKKALQSFNPANIKYVSYKSI